MQRWKQTVFGDWCNIAPGVKPAANQQSCKTARIPIQGWTVAFAAAYFQEAKGKKRTPEEDSTRAIMCGIKAHFIRRVISLC